jgi:hypothetical protein
LYEDRRLGGEAIITLGQPKDWGMRIPNRVLDCVSFFFVYGSRSGLADVADHGGTGFFVSVTGAHDAIRHMYLVTAKHVAVEAPKAGDGRVFLRYTSAEGHGIEPIEVVSDKWKFHPDPSVDVAVMHFDSYAVVKKDRWVLPRPITLSAFLTGEKINKYKVGIGDELTVVGLFRQRPGIGQNIPIVRHGIISAMPGEPIPDSDAGPPFIAFLAEIRSIRGLSGSPVFVNLALGRNADGSINEGGSLALIGLVRGHFEIRRTKGKVFDREMTDDELDLLAVNSGIAMVTPISAVTDILNDEDFVSERQENDRVQLMGKGTTTDSGFRSKATPTDAGMPGADPEH